MKRIFSLIIPIVLIVSSIPISPLPAYATPLDKTVLQSEVVAKPDDCEIEVSNDIMQMASFLNDEHADFVEDITIDISKNNDDVHIAGDSADVALSVILDAEKNNDNIDEIKKEYATSNDVDDTYLSPNQLMELGYECAVSDKTVTISKTYQSQQLICFNEDIDSIYGAVSAMSYNNFTVLKYDSVEDTVKAKDSFEKDNIDVCADISLSSQKYTITDMQNEYGKENLETARFIENNINTSTAKDLIVAVVDTGVDYNHEFLKNRMVKGINLLDEEQTAMDGHKHGTHVAGIIVNNTPSNVKIMPIKTLDNRGNGTLAMSALGIQYAADHGAKVINMSFGGRVFNKNESKIIDDAIAYATQKGCVCVAAAGNEKDYTDNYSPANNKQAITVAAVNNEDTHCDFSNVGKSVDISAPGYRIVSTLPNNKYGALSGTSMATPFACAAAALFLCENSSLTPARVKEKIKETAIDLGFKGHDYMFGAGRIDFGYFLGDRTPAESVTYYNNTEFTFCYSTYLKSPPKQLNMAVYPLNATDKSFSYECTNPEVVDLSNGLITPAAPGETSVKLYLENGSYTTIKVLVNDAGSWLDCAANEYEGGSGTIDDPYLIKTAEQLAKISKDYYECKLPYVVFYEQIADIDLAGKQWYPITARDEERIVSYCNFDGGGYNISNLTFNQTENDLELMGVGLFYSNCGQMENINLIDVNINSNYNAVGGIAGLSDGIINNCTVSGTIQGPMAGGIVGTFRPMSSKTYDLIISNCYVDAKICGRLIGGITEGTANGIIANCIFMGSLVPTAENYFTGGISCTVRNDGGYADDTKIINCISNANIFSVKQTDVSNEYSSYEEFAGTQLKSYVENCYCYEDLIKKDENPEDTNIKIIDETFVSDSNNFTNDDLWNKEYSWNLDKDWIMNEEGISHRRQTKRIKLKDYYYGDLANSIVLYGYTGKSSEISIPSTIDGKPVRYIGEKFYTPNSILRTISFPSSVEDIGKCAFYENKEIENITLPEGLREIGKYAFFNCPFLLSVTLPSTLEHLGHYAFALNRYTENLFFKGPGSCADSEMNLGEYDITQIRYLNKYAATFNKEQWCGAKLSSFDPNTVLEISFRNYQSQYYSLNVYCPREARLYYGDSIKLKPIIYNKAAANTKIIWSSSNKKIPISQDGELKLTDEYGTTVTARAADGSCEAEIDVVFDGYHPYTIVYKGNGSTSGSMSNQKVPMVEESKLLPNKYSRVGYTFSGWATSSKGKAVYKNKEKIYMLDTSKLGKNVYLYAKWKANTYKVKFNKNGGSGTMDTEIFKYDTAKALNKCKFKAPRGKVFAGWSKTRNGTPVYVNGQSVKNLTTKNGTTVELYAKYVTPKKYKISYVMNGGKQPSKYSKTFKSGTGCTLPKPTKKGYTFAGWYTDSKFKGKKITTVKPWIAKNQKFYAKWVKNK